MAVERAPGGTSLIDVLDRVLDKGIVIDAWVRISLVGIDLITVEARVVVASIDTYLRYAEAMGITAPIARPPAVAPPVEPRPARGELIVPPGVESPTEARARRRTAE
jgi:gas vesicle structural protein